MRRRETAAPDRVQTGVRMHKQLVKVLKALAEYYDLSLGDLLEDLVLSAFAARKPFSAAALARVGDLMRLYDMEPPTALRLPAGGDRP